MIVNIGYIFFERQNIFSTFFLSSSQNSQNTVALSFPVRFSRDLVASSRVVVEKYVNTHTTFILSMKLNSTVEQEVVK